MTDADRAEVKRIINDIVGDIISVHSHTDIDGSSRIAFTDLLITKQGPLTIADTNTLSTGGAAVLSTADSTTIANTRTRVNQIETFLKTLGLFK